ncbi:DUF2459 domain-containing protein [Hyunsoonleella sp. 2307UL5-6]|uniref:DUF2459 domain-containing protein n=1 Tax=Hyunsoonleella sp. 2307UL5-6 TaxID=3384768 RepID=UPI0039BD0528
MKNIKRILKWLGYLLSTLIAYIIISLIFSSITVNKNDEITKNIKSVYLHTNGVHLDIVIHKNNISSKTLENIYILEDENYISFGWGDENFYINTPTWGDLTLKNGFSAMFLKSTSLMHVTRYTTKDDNWTLVKLSERELNALNTYIFQTFKLNNDNKFDILPNTFYTAFDNFYKANGSYSCLDTCNSWVNTGFKASDLKACLWTPFDFGLINKYN